MEAVDSSVIVAACAAWHESHASALRALRSRPRLVAHCALEAYSVLTRLPAPWRVPAPLVTAFLEDRFPSDPLVLTPTALRRVVSELEQRGVSGGAAWDGLVALTAATHGATLLTLDRRAEGTYRRCGVSRKLLN